MSEKMSTNDKLALSGTAAGCGCISALILVKLAVIAAIIFGIVELGLFLTRH